MPTIHSTPPTHLNRLPETISSLQAFRKRNSEAQRIHASLSAQPTTIDISYYRSVLKNQAVVDEAERALRAFKPITYDVQAHVKAIEAFEAKAVSGDTPCPFRIVFSPSLYSLFHDVYLLSPQVAKAEETSQRIDEELKELQATLDNIEQARPFDDLTVRPHPPAYINHIVRTTYQ